MLGGKRIRMLCKRSSRRGNVRELIFLAVPSPYALAVTHACPRGGHQTCRIRRYSETKPCPFCPEGDDLRFGASIKRLHFRSIAGV